MKITNLKICVVGLGYVGLPLAVEFGKYVEVNGFDINKKRIETLNQGIDETREVSDEDLKNSKCTFSDDSKIINESNFIITAVPTPVDTFKRPDLTLVKAVSKSIGENLSKGSIVVFASTVYPGVTEEICIPIIEEESGMKCGVDWSIGYSPERINPGDKEHTVDKIVKVVSGYDDETLDTISDTYSIIAKAGVHRAPSIKVAEAAKIIENIQRDINIALVNEFSTIFDKMGINTLDVIEAAGTKWNFHKYTPGLVGGHCIGVDPYYLAYKAKKLGIDSKMILAGRDTNEAMTEYVAKKIIDSLKEVGKNVKESKVYIMGLTFKENITDPRNSKIGDVAKLLDNLGIEVVGYDPNLTDEVVKDEFNLKNIKPKDIGKVDAIIIATPHKEILEMKQEEFLKLMDNNPIVFDIKNKFRFDINHYHKL
jgi:UDP-N-acetyl-D-galactosamine dehydrogenase